MVFKSVGPLARDYVFLQNKQFRLITWSSDVLGRLQRKTERQFLDYEEILDSNRLFWNKKIVDLRSLEESEGEDLVNHYLNLEEEMRWSLFIFGEYSLDLGAPPAWVII